MEDHRKRRSETSLETGACLKIIFLDLGLPKAPKLLRTVTGLSSSRARLRSMRSWKTLLGTTTSWSCSLLTALWSIEKLATTLTQSWCSPVWRQQWLIKLSDFTGCLHWGWGGCFQVCVCWCLWRCHQQLLQGILLVAQLTWGTIGLHLGRCWKHLEAQGPNDEYFLLISYVYTILVRYLCTSFKTCLYMWYTCICTCRYTIWLCKQYAQQKASVPPAKHTQLLEARLLPCDVWHLQYYIGIKFRGLHLLTSCVPGIERC